MVTYTTDYCFEQVKVKCFLSFSHIWYDMLNNKCVLSNSKCSNVGKKGPKIPSIVFIIRCFYFKGTIISLFPFNGTCSEHLYSANKQLHLLMQMVLDLQSKQHSDALIKCNCIRKRWQSLQSRLSSLTESHGH